MEPVSDFVPADLAERFTLARDALAAVLVLGERMQCLPSQYRHDAADVLRVLAAKLDADRKGSSIRGRMYKNTKSWADSDPRSAFGKVCRWLLENEPATIKTISFAVGVDKAHVSKLLVSSEVFEKCGSVENATKGARPKLWRIMPALVEVVRARVVKKPQGGE